MPESREPALPATSDRTVSSDLAVVLQMYEALQTRNSAAIVALLHEECLVQTAPGLPIAGGQTARGPIEALRHVWGEIDQHFDVQPSLETCAVGPAGTVVGIGTYRGRGRASERDLDAWFAHVWTVASGRITALRQITDTVAWSVALERQ